MPICSANAEVKWRHMRGLAEACDNMAGVLNIPSYVQLVLGRSTPFFMPDVVPVEFVQHFQLDAAGYITSRWLTPALGSEAGWNPGSGTNLAELAEAGRLFFVSEQDACWCCTVFQVTKEGGRFSLKTVADQQGCYQTLEVPEPGELLDYSQHFIPAAYTSIPQTVHRPEGTPDPDWDTVKRCEADSGEKVHIKYIRTGSSGLGSSYRVDAAGRLLKGKLVWNIKASDFQTLFGKIVEIIGKSCGCAGDGVVKRATGTHEDIKQNCPVAVTDLIWTMCNINGNARCDLPGGLRADDGVLELPWATPTSGAEYCDGSGFLKVYCNTVEHLSDLIAACDSHLSAYETPCKPKCKDDPSSSASVDCSIIADPFIACNGDIGQSIPGGVQQVCASDGVTRIGYRWRGTFYADDVDGVAALSAAITEACIAAGYPPP